MLFFNCDWDHYALTNTVPAFEKKSSAKSTQVFIACDGLPYAIIDALAQRGELDSHTWQIAPSISPFPSVSSHSWTRILRTGSILGYEPSYFDEKKDELSGGTLFALAQSGIPHVRRFLFDSEKYFAAIDYSSEGVTDSLVKYVQTQTSIGESLDGLLHFLDGRTLSSETTTIFFSDLDVAGHKFGWETVLEGASAFFHELVKFRDRHPERHIEYTIFSDHGGDFIPSAPDELITTDEFLRAASISAVDSFAAGAALGGDLFAVPVEVLRLSYFGLHTTPSMAGLAAQNLSSDPRVDIAISVSNAKPADQHLATEWVDVWRAGVLEWHLGYDATHDRYYMSSTGPFLDFGFKIPSIVGPIDSVAEYIVLSDEEAFVLSEDSEYPDFFSHVRTGVKSSTVSNSYEVLVSIRRPYAIAGFTFSKETGVSSFHGSLSRGSTEGIVATTDPNIELPKHMRADTILDVFPRLRAYLQKTKHTGYYDSGERTELDYKLIDQIRSQYSATP